MGEAFEHGIQGDPADPLPRLGMGLAKICDGDPGGTREIETAASLDPNNAFRITPTRASAPPLEPPGQRPAEADQAEARAREA